MEGETTDGPAHPAAVTISGGDPVAVVVAGEIDQSNEAQLWSDLVPAATGRARRLQLDLGGVTFMGSAGLAVLLRLKERVEARGGHIEITAASAIVRRVVDVTGLAHHLGLPPP